MKVNESYKNISTQSKIAFVCFIIGKLFFIPAIVTVFAFREWFILFISLYSFFVLMSGILAAWHMISSKKKDNIPTKKEVEKWIKHYNFSLVKKNT